MNANKLAGKIAVITGATSGLGLSMRNPVEGDHDSGAKAITYSGGKPITHSGAKPISDSRLKAISNLPASGMVIGFSGMYLLQARGASSAGHHAAS